MSFIVLDAVLCYLLNLRRRSLALKPDTSTPLVFPADVGGASRSPESNLHPFFASASSRDKQIHLKHVLVIGQTKGFEHDSVSDGMAAIYNMGRDSGLWDATLRTDVELITKKTLERNAKNLDYFDALVFVSTTGELDLDDAQKKDMLSFIQDDGKGFVGIHAALDTNYKWPEYGEMIGGWFDEHPWSTFNAPIINEDPNFPAVRHFPARVREIRRDLPA